MILEALASNGLPGFLVYDTISATPMSTIFSNQAGMGSSNGDDGLSLSGFFGPDDAVRGLTMGEEEVGGGEAQLGQGRRKRRRRPRSYKNKEEAESQRMTHIAVERNRRRLMNEHLAELRSLMPESYIQRGDQASIVGGAIDFVKELEQLLQSLEAQKRAFHLLRRRSREDDPIKLETSREDDEYSDHPPFGQFFSYPQYAWRHTPVDHHHHHPPSADGHRTPEAVADIEVTLIETHASVRILAPRRPRQLLRVVAGLRALRLTVLHLNVTTLESMVLYSLSTKVEEGCHLATVDDIAAAVHHILCLIGVECSSE